MAALESTTEHSEMDTSSPAAKRRGVECLFSTAEIGMEMEKENDKENYPTKV